MNTSPSGAALDRVGRAIGHAVRMLAVAARGRHVDVANVGPASRSRRESAVVAVGAGLFAVVAADAQDLVDQQHVGRLADALARSGSVMMSPPIGLGFASQVRSQALEHPASMPPRNVGLRMSTRLNVFAVSTIVSVDRPPPARSPNARHRRQQRHFADVIAGGDV